MLLSLNVNNFAIIDKIEVEFDKGLNIITGETGAGKSIIIGALSLALGQRANVDNIKSGEEKIKVEAMFDVPKNNEKLISLLDDLDIDYSDNNLILVREVYENGRNVSRVNGNLINVGTLKQIGSHLVDIHGQNSAQRILDKSTHLSFLDEYAASELNEYKNPLKQAYKDYKKLYEEYIKISDNQVKEEENLARYKREYEQINSVELYEGLDDELENREKILSNIQEMFEYINGSYDLLYKKEGNICESIVGVEENLTKAGELDSNLSENISLIGEARTLIEEAVLFLREYKDTLEYEPSELDEIQDKLNKINILKRTYGENIQKILEYKVQIETKINLIDNFDEKIKSIKDGLNESKKKYEELALKVRQIRKEKAKSLCEEIKSNLELLSMKDTDFSIKFTDLADDMQFGENGIDDVEFLISTNNQESLKPLDKIASGGEISRIMLSIKSVLSEIDHTPTMIFDEIDSGISGRTAQVVAKQMWDLSKRHQILAITHLPQIASMADSNYLIEKKHRNSVVYTSFKKLDEDERISELARMLGGITITQNTKIHASEMFSQAKNYKNKI